MRWIGRHTMGIYLLHVPLIRQVVMPLLGKAGFSSPPGFAAFVGMIITAAISALLVKIIDRVLPEAFGKFDPPRGSHNEVTT